MLFKIILISIVIIFGFNLQQARTEQIEEKREGIDQITETIGIVRKIEEQKLILAIPRGNVMTLPVYDPTRVEEMSKKILFEVLLDKDSIVPKNLKEGNVVFIKSKEDMSRQTTVYAIEIKFLAEAPSSEK